MSQPLVATEPSDAALHHVYSPATPPLNKIPLDLGEAYPNFYQHIGFNLFAITAAVYGFLVLRLTDMGVMTKIFSLQQLYPGNRDNNLPENYAASFSMMSEMLSIMVGAGIFAGPLLIFLLISSFAQRKLRRRLTELGIALVVLSFLSVPIISYPDFRTWAEDRYGVSVDMGSAARRDPEPNTAVVLSDGTPAWVAPTLSGNLVLVLKQGFSTEMPPYPALLGQKIGLSPASIQEVFP